MSPHLRRTTRFTEPSNELGEVEDLQRLCVAHLFIVFSHWIHSACEVQYGTFSLRWLKGYSPLPAGKILWTVDSWVYYSCIVELLAALNLNWSSEKGRTDLKISLTLLERADQKFQRQPVGKTNLRKAPGSPWGGSCCRYDCFKCTAIADYSLIFLCKSLTGAQTGCMHLISASIKACTLAKVISD